MNHVTADLILKLAQIIQNIFVNEETLWTEFFLIFSCLFFLHNLYDYDLSLKTDSKPPTIFRLDSDRR